MLDIALVGTGGMMPLPNRYLASLLIRSNGQMVLVDCGEGTQVSLKLLGWGFKNIGVICVTHFHADHVSGLPGLLLTIGNSGREEPMTIVGPPGIGSVVAGLCVITPELPYNINIIEIPKTGTDEPLNLAGLEVRALPLDHRMTCLGYSFYLKRIGKFDIDKAKKLDLPVQFWSLLQKGETIEHNGKIYTPDMVLGDTRRGIKLCYITDTRPTLDIPAFAENSDLFICEGMIGDEERYDRIKAHKHMIFREAAELALEANAAELWLTHFSPAMTNPQEFLQNARKVYVNSHIGKDRMTKTILFHETEEIY